MADLLGNDIGLNYKGLLNLFTTINTGLDATLRVVTDGEGDSSPLYLSTTAIGLGTASIWDNTNGRLGIGTITPLYKLHVKTTTNDGTIALGIENSTKGSNSISFSDRGYIFGYAYNASSLNYELGFYGSFSSGYLGLYKSNILKVNINANGGTDPIFFNSGASVGIGTETPNASSLLDVLSTTKGFLPPRMTTTQKNAIATPAAGLMVYDTTLAKLCVYTTAWETITSS